MKKLYPILALLILLATPVIGQNFWKGSIRGEGPTVEKEINLTGFEGVRNGFSCDVHLTQGNSHKIIVKGQQNIIDNLRFDVKDKALRIKYDRMVRRAEPVHIYITLPTLTVATVSGSGDLETVTPFRDLGELDVAVSGSGNVDLDVQATEIRGKVSGSGGIRLEGSTGQLDVGISGSGNVRAIDLKAQDCTVSVSGSGNATVYSSGSLNANVSGSGNVRYKGSNVQVRSRVSGSGSIKAI